MELSSYAERRLLFRSFSYEEEEAETSRPSG